MNQPEVNMAKVANSSPQKMDALQALRAIAAALVVFEHGLLTYGQKIGDLPDFWMNYSLGSLGVKLFFCISGFIIFTSSTSLGPGWVSVSLFARRRLIRIVPLYWCATLIYALKLSLQGTIPHSEQLIYSLFFIPYADSSGDMRPVLGVGWTLNFEMFFYITLGCALFLKKNIRVRSVSVLMLLLILARSSGALTPGNDSLTQAIFFLADPYLLFFLTGMLIGSLNEKSKFDNESARGNAGVPIISALLSLFILIIFSIKLNSNWLIFSELLLCSACVHICIMARQREQKEESNWIQRHIVHAGDGSYSTYLTHGFIMGPAARLTSLFHIQLTPWIFALCMVMACTATGIVLFKYFESPLLRKLNARYGKIR